MIAQEKQKTAKRGRFFSSIASIEHSRHGAATIPAERGVYLY